MAGIWEDTPQEAVPSSEVQDVEATPVPESDFVGLPVRAEGDRIWLLKEGKKHWVTNAEAYSKLGFKFGDEREIDQATLNALVEGEPVR